MRRSHTQTAAARAATYNQNGNIKLSCHVPRPVSDGVISPVLWLKTMLCACRKPGLRFLLPELPLRQ
jgi:hypothetical protein